MEENDEQRNQTSYSAAATSSSGALIQAAPMSFTLLPSRGKAGAPVGAAAEVSLEAKPAVDPTSYNQMASQFVPGVISNPPRPSQSSVRPIRAEHHVASGPTVGYSRGKAHLRKAAGMIWSDPTLDDWPDEDCRVFCGDLGNEVTDELLSNAFRHLKSFQRARVIRDKRTGKGKGFGFVSFSNPEDMLRALKDMDRKYVGNRPIRVMRSKWQEREIGSTANKRSFDEINPVNSKSLKKFKPMKPVTGGKKVALTPAAPLPPGPPGMFNQRGRGGGFRGMRPPPFGMMGRP